MTGSAIQNNTINDGSRGLEVGLRSIQAEPFKTFSTNLFFSSFFFFHFSKVSFVCFYDREISTSEIVICSLLSLHILTHNELVCLTPAAIRRSVGPTVNLFT